MKLLFTSFLLFSIATTGCTSSSGGGGNESDSGTSAPAADSTQSLSTDWEDSGTSKMFKFSDLIGKTWTFVVVERADQLKGRSEVYDSDFSTLEPTTHYTLGFGERAVEFVDEGIFGRISQETDTSKEYLLDEGLFAGGKLEVLIPGDGGMQFQAKYTVYGSGVPIISIEKGYLKTPN